jgi:transposase
MELMTMKCHSQRVILERIDAGQYKFCGSSICFNASRRKWFAHIAYQMPVKAQQPQGAKTAFLRPGKTRPWTMRLDGRRLTFGGRGEAVAHNRRQVLLERWGRSNNYRWSSSSTKGHGRNRATLPLHVPVQRWKNFVKTHNQTVAKAIIEECFNKGVRTLYYLQPTGTQRDNTFLATAGKVQGRVDASRWDWFQFGSCLGYVNERLGKPIEVIVRKGREARKAVA